MKNRTLLLYAFAYLAFLYVPVLVLPVFSFNASQFIAFPLSGFTTRWYGALGADSALQHALGNSLKVGIVTALLSTCWDWQRPAPSRVTGCAAPAWR